MVYFFSFLFIVILLIVAGIPLALISEKRKKKELEKVFGERQVLSERDFYEKYFQEKGVHFFVVRKIRQILEQELDVDLSQLSAQDDFSKNLSFFWEYDSLADVEILLRIEEEFEIKIEDKEAKNQTNTIENIVDLAWEKVQEKENRV